MLTYAALAAAAVSGAVAAAASSTSPALNSTAPWWEKVTVTISSDGKPRSCTYESSLRPSGGAECDVVGAGAAKLGGSSSPEQYTRITFERRFRPDAISRDDVEVSPGDTLLGRHVMNLAIDAAGTVRRCQVIARSGELPPEYGCEEAAAERFEANAPRGGARQREGFMTVLVYGHQEHIA